jgi:hypothetical protein
MPLAEQDEPYCTQRAARDSLVDAKMPKGC